MSRESRFICKIYVKLAKKGSFIKTYSGGGGSRFPLFCLDKLMSVWDNISMIRPKQVRLKLSQGIIKVNFLMY